MAAFLDNCRFNPTLGGTTDWTYSSAVAGYQSPTAAGAVTTTVYEVFAIDASNNWEMARGACTITGGVPTFARTTVLSNSLGTGTASGQSGAGTKISFAAAPQVAVVAIKESLISVEEANSFTSTQKAQAQTNIFLGPTTQSFTSGSGTYTTAGNVKWLEVIIVGGGGGGGGTGASSPTAGSTGGTTTFSTFTAVGGGGGSTGGANATGGTGGTGTAIARVQGQFGGFGRSVSTVISLSGVGGSSALGAGAQQINNTATAGLAGDSPGGGGSGASGDLSTYGTASGGAGGEYAKFNIVSPSATYSYAVGAGGAGGTGTNAGGVGSAGAIYVIEHYGS